MTQETIILGRRRNGEPLRVPLPEALTHTLVLGKSGSGKTFWLLAVIFQMLALKRRPTVCLVDCKGETFELLQMLLSIFDAGSALPPSAIFALSPWSRFGVPLNPLAPVPGLDPHVQASTVVNLLSDLSDGFGPRMKNLARNLVCAVMGRGSLLDVHRALVDERVAIQLAANIEDVELRGYLTETFPDEPDASKQSLRARIEDLIAVPNVRAMLCADGSVPPGAFLSSPLTLVNLGAGGMGSRRIGDFIGSWIFALISSAIYSRGTLHGRPHAIVAIDEWQRIARFASEDLSDILSTARSSGVNLVLLNQYAEQISAVSPALWAGLRENVVIEMLFRPGDSELHHLDALLPLTGRQVDPLRPDRLLSESEEKKQVVRALGRLRPRDAVCARLRSDDPVEVVTTLTLPIDEARAAWAALGPNERATCARGRFGVPMESLRPARVVGVPAVDAVEVVAGVSPQQTRRPLRPKLRVLP